MEVVHLNQKQLATRWHLSEACLERWRSEGIGPKFMKLKGRVLYRPPETPARMTTAQGNATALIRQCSCITMQGIHPVDRSAPCPPPSTPNPR